jgi:hypothetical protein
MFSVSKNTILLLSVVLLFFVGCSKQVSNQNTSISPKIIDNINLLSPKVKKYIEEMCKFPDGIFVLVRTMDKLDRAKIGSYATDTMEEEAYWEQVRPRGFFARWIKQDKPWSMGVYVLVSKEPNLIQIRYGERIRLEAYRSGLAIGNKYLQIQQQFKRHGANQGTLNALKELSQELPSALNLPWYLRYGKMLVALTFSEFEELVSPSDGMYSTWILRPYLKLIEALDGFSPVWYFLLLNFFLYFSIQILFTKIFVNVVLQKSEPRTKAQWRKLVSIVISAFFAVPFLGGVILLNNGRFEDYLALQQLGISLTDQASLGLGWFMNVTGFWLAAFITLMNFINLLITDPLSEPFVVYYGSTNPDIGDPTMDILNMAPRYPTLSSKWRIQQTGNHTYVLVYDEYVYRPRFSVLVFMLFMPKAIGLIVLIKEFFDLAINLNQLDHANCE